MLGHPGAQIWVTPGCPLSHPGESPSPDEISQPASPGALAAIAKTKTPAIMWDRKVRGTLGSQLAAGAPLLFRIPDEAGRGHTSRLQMYTLTPTFSV